MRDRDLIDLDINRLEEATKRTHETIKDLKAARRDLDEFAKEFRNMVNQEVTKQLDALGNSTKKAIELSEDTIMKRFAKLEKMVFESPNAPHESLEDLFRKVISEGNIRTLLKAAEQVVSEQG